MDHPIDWFEVLREPVMMIPRISTAELASADERLRTYRKLLSRVQTAAGEGSIPFPKKEATCTCRLFHVPTPLLAAAWTGRHTLKTHTGKRREMNRKGRYSSKADETSKLTQFVG